MATKRFYATRDLKNPSYGTRMLKAGDPVDLDGPKARLYLALGAVTATKPQQKAYADATQYAAPAGAEAQNAAPKKPAAKRTRKSKPAAKK